LAQSKENARGPPKRMAVIPKDLELHEPGIPTPNA
jgi:hypothetical protein